MTRKISMDQRMATLIMSTIALAVALSAGSYLLAGGNSSSRPVANGEVTVSANAQLEGKPDTLVIQLSVVTTSSSAAAALNRNNVEMSHLQKIFRSSGIRAVDLQTSSLSVNPNYNNNGKLTGYGANDDLSVTTHAIGRAGTVIDSAENAVGNDVEINSITFSLSNDASLLRQARVLAMQKAHSEAADFARGAGESLGGVAKISQNQSTSPMPFSPALGSAASTARTAVPLRPGTEQVSVNVDVVYHLVS